MSLTSRIRLIFNARAAHLLDDVEDPPLILDYAYSQQLEMLAALKRGLVEVSTSKHQLEAEITEIGSRTDALDSRAARAMERGREDLARLLLERKHRALAGLEGLDQQLAELAAEEARLAGAHQEMAARIEEFRLHRVVVSARYTAASAEAGVAEVLVGVGGDLAELSLAVARAEEKTGRMMGRAAALGALVRGHSLEVAFGPDAVETELRRLDLESAVSADLDALRGQVKESK